MARRDLTIDQAFIRAVQTGNSDLVLSSYEDGLRTMDITLAANESARTGEARGDLLRTACGLDSRKRGKSMAQQKWASPPSM